MQRTLSPITAIAAIAAVMALVVSVVALARTDGSVDLASGEPAAAPAAGEEVAAVDDVAPGAAAAPVPMTLTEFALDPDPLVVGSDGSIEVTNEGAIPHNAKLKGMEEEYGTADLNNGESASIDLTGLAPGEYAMYCDIAGHEASGMTSTLVVDVDGSVDVAAGVDGAQAEGGADDDGALTGIEQAEYLRANYEASVSQFPAATAVMGTQPMEPEILEDGTKVFELTLSRFEWEVAPGEFVIGTGYNGQVPGPWIHAEVGDTVTLRLINELEDEAATLHPHGVFRHDFAIDGVGMISMEPIMPGETWEETFIAADVSVGMYHGHDNGVHQVPDGAFGAFTIGQLPLPPQADNVVAEEVMILNDAGTIGLTLNGKSFPATEPYVLTQGEQMIMHFYNEGLSPHPMHLHNQPMMVIAKDGYPLPQPIVMDTVNVAPGERYSVVIFGETLGTWVFHCHILTHIERSDGSVFGMFTVLIVNPSEDADADEQAIADDVSRRVGRGLLGGAASAEALGESSLIDAAGAAATEEDGDS